MVRRRGAAHHWAGPHLSISAKPQAGRKDPDLSDPANGARVPRCWTCGYPERPGIGLTMFELRIEGRPAGRWQICDHCYYERNPVPTMVDPLDVQSA